MVPQCNQPSHHQQHPIRMHPSCINHVKSKLTNQASVSKTVSSNASINLSKHKSMKQPNHVIMFNQKRGLGEEKEPARARASRRVAAAAVGQAAHG